MGYNGAVIKDQTLFIKNPQAHRLAAQLSARMKITLTEAVIQALENQVRATPKPIDRKKMGAILAQFDSLPILDKRAEDEILGYDKFGIPS